MVQRERANSIAFKERKLFPIRFLYPDKSHVVHSFWVSARTITAPDQEENSYNTSISVYDETGVPQWYFLGNLLEIDGKKHYFSHISKNEGTHVDRQGIVTAQSPYRGLIGETISQLILRGIVDYWYSDVQLSPGGHKMYRELLQSYHHKIKKAHIYGSWQYVLSMDTSP